MSLFIWFVILVLVFPFHVVYPPAAEFTLFQLNTQNIYVNNLYQQLEPFLESTKLLSSFSSSSIPSSSPSVDWKSADKFQKFGNIFSLPNRSNKLLLGVVSYDPAVGTIWEEMKNYFHSQDISLDFILFTNYEQQINALLTGVIDIAWNGPIAHVLTQEIAQQHNTNNKLSSSSSSFIEVISLGMRDSDCDFRSVIAVKTDANITQVTELNGKTLFTGSSDSPQAHVVPLYWLEDMLNIEFASVEPFDLDLGKHGDTALGEIRVLEELSQAQPHKSAVAGIVSKMMWDRGIAGKLSTVDPVKLADK